MLRRFEENPVIRAEDINYWGVGFRAKNVYNPGSARANGEVVLLPRVQDEEGISRPIVARSSDGHHIDYISSRPALNPEFYEERKGIEDTRITPMQAKDLESIIGPNGSDPHIITYVAFMDDTNGYDTRVGLAYTPDFKSFTKLPFPRFPHQFVNAKNCVVFPEKVKGRFAGLYRPKTDPLAIRLAYSYNLFDWGDAGEVLRPYAEWNRARVGAAAPPILVQNGEMSGWLTSFHGADLKNGYSTGLAILDYDDPRKVISITANPVLVPEEPYEKYGQVPDVVFLTGLLQQGDELLAHWGGADSCVVAGYCGLSEIMEYMKRPENIKAARLVQQWLK